MDTSTQAPDPILNGLKVVALENELLHLTILPEAGARIWQIRYKPLNADLLWNNPQVAPSRQPLFASYDDTWSGGWDELFPNDEAGEIEGVSYPDHGELWSGEWTATEVTDDTGPAVRQEFRTPISEFKAEKTIRLLPGRSVIEVEYRLTNLSAHFFPFLLKLHPAFAVSAAHRIDFPAMRVVREVGFEGSLDEAPTSFEWPFAACGDRIVDLRQVPDVSSKALHFFYGTEMASGWCGITNRANRLATALRFDPEVFSSCWLFATYGGWRDLNVSVLEPATGYPYHMKTMMESGRARQLAPGESLSTRVLFSVQPGMGSIGGVDADGTILSGDEA